MPTIENISLERIEELAKKAGHKPHTEHTVMDVLTNQQSNVMFTRFAYLIAAELNIKPVGPTTYVNETTGETEPVFTAPDDRTDPE